MILEPAIDEKKFSVLPPLSESGSYDMDRFIEIITDSDEDLPVQDDMVSSNICEPSCSQYDANVNLISSCCAYLSESESHPCVPQNIYHKAIVQSEIPKTENKVTNSNENPRTKESFLNYFSLVPNAKAISIQQEHKEVIDIDCEITAVEGLDNCDNVPITSPRTPRSLMSQLSRDHEGSTRKRLFSLSETTNEAEDQYGEPMPKISIQGSLLGIDFSSFLGQRVRKHAKSDVSNHIIKNIEAYCTTTWVKNYFVEKLRHRQADYPVTFRKNKKGSSRHRRCHEFKFTASERHEFMRIAKTGLNKDGRRLKRQMKKAMICLTPVSPEIIRSWKRRTPASQPIYIDDDISIIQIDPAPGSSTTFSASRESNPYFQASLQTSNVYRNIKHEPRPQYLVKKVETQINGHKSSELVFLPLAGENHKNSNQQYRKRNMGPASRRKQNFSTLRNDLSYTNDIISFGRPMSDSDVRSHGSPSNGNVDANFPFNYNSGQHSNNFKKVVSILQNSQNSRSPKQNTFYETIEAIDFNKYHPSSAIGQGNMTAEFRPSTSSMSLPGNSVIQSTNFVRSQPNSVAKKSQFSNFPNLQKSLSHPFRTDAQLAMLNASNRQNVANNNSDICKMSSPLAIASVYSLSGNETIPVAHIQIGSLTGSNENSSNCPSGIIPSELSSCSISNNKPSNKMAEYIVERNIDNDTNEIVEVICIEDDD